MEEEQHFCNAYQINSPHSNSELVVSMSDSLPFLKTEVLSPIGRSIPDQRTHGNRRANSHPSEMWK